MRALTRSSMRRQAEEVVEQCEDDKKSTEKPPNVIEVR